jgi:hypothetical protein
MSEQEVQDLLAKAWEIGYWAGFDDGAGDSYVEHQSRNPYRKSA